MFTPDDRARAAADASPPPDATTDSLDAPAADPAAVPPSTERYRLGEEVGRGGMGAVYRAADDAFGREVAVKVLRPEYAPDSGVARRFAEEARITGQMQHPGIPPAHDLGTLPDGRPFLAMKLIRGETLERLLHARPEPSAELGRFVAAFEQVCQAVAYAHAHGVIHRDLKPSNVMVGAFGEVQVMDWGLAKVLAAGQASTADPEQTTAATQIQSLRDGDGSLTQAGSVLGTPAYMPPEQAAGAVGKVDARSDVFGLGAILAVILTGRPPFAAGSAETVRVQSAQGRLDECFSRLDGSGADPELVALCKRCLCPEAAGRPGDAGEVARAVAQLRQQADERARRAELERVRAEAEAREQRRRRRMQVGLVAAAAAVLLGGGALAWWHSERLGRNAEAVRALLGQCADALRGGDAERAAVTLEAAQKRAAEGGAGRLAGRLDGLGRDLELLRELDAVDRFRWTPVENKFPDAAAVAGRYRTALGRFGMDPDAGGADAAADRAAGSAVRDRLLSALDRLLAAQKSAAVRAALRALDAQPYRDAVRDAILAGDRAKMAELGGRPEALGQPPGFAAIMGDSTPLSVQRRRQVLEAAVRRRPSDLGLLMDLPITYPINQREGSDERLRWLQAAVAAAPDNAPAHYNAMESMLRGPRAQTVSLPRTVLADHAA
jgi:hypothetical protein